MSVVLECFFKIYAWFFEIYFLLITFSSNLHTSDFNEQSEFAELSDIELLEHALAFVEFIDYYEMLAETKKIKKKDADEIIEVLADCLVRLEDEYFLRKDNY